MEYEWVSMGFLYYNHLRDNIGDYLCPNGDYFQKEANVKYDPDKEHCPECSRRSFNLVIKGNIPVIPKTTCANILHINRKIFI